MNSPFLQVPETEWVASNAWAFALRDRHPVSPGHTLVVTRRPVATWFEATAEEQRALFALVDEVKRQLDAGPPRPDGYNVGFNVGQAAGQTVFHLHVHVIPRYHGDVADPRGGVRHVIAHKALPLEEPPPPDASTSARLLLLEALNNLHVWSREELRAPHKPLLLLLMLARLQRGAARLISFREVEPQLLYLLKIHGPEQDSSSASYSFWRLQNDGIWEVVVDNPADLVTRKGNTDPTLTSLRGSNARGGFLPEYDALLREDPALLRQAALLLLGLHFPKETHQLLLNQLGLGLDG